MKKRHLLPHLILKSFLRCAFYLSGFRAYYRDRLPTDRPYILICNHAAFIDSLYIICALPHRVTICGAKPRLFRNVFLRTLMRLANIIKVESDKSFKQDCADLLLKNNVILIYPEMGRNPEKLGQFKDLAAEVALANNTVVIPSYLYGTTKNQPGRISLAFGKEIIPQGDAHNLNRHFRDAIETLRDGIEMRRAI